MYTNGVQVAADDDIVIDPHPLKNVHVPDDNLLVAAWGGRVSRFLVSIVSPVERPVSTVQYQQSARRTADGAM